MMNRVCSVLVVDDEPLPRKLISDRISKIPDVVLAASLSNGQSAKEYLLQHTVDMVITDIKMPVSDGLDLAEFVQQLDPLCTTVIISGYSEFEYAKKALQFGVQDYLLKPVQFSQVAEAVERCRKSAVMIRKQQMISRGSELDSLEGAIQQTFLGNTPAKSWHQPVDARRCPPNRANRGRNGKAEGPGSHLSEHTAGYSQQPCRSEFALRQSRL